MPLLHAPKGNYGDIENTGFEISLNTHPITGKFEWDSDFQISFNKNKLKGLAGTANAQIVGYGQWTDVVSVSSVGESLYNFYGFVCDGVYKDLEDLQTSPKPAKYPANGVFDRTNTVWVGDVKYKDISWAILNTKTYLVLTVCPMALLTTMTRPISVLRCLSLLLAGPILSVTRTSTCPFSSTVPMATRCITTFP